MNCSELLWRSLNCALVVLEYTARESAMLCWDGRGFGHGETGIDAPCLPDIDLFESKHKELCHGT